MSTIDNGVNLVTSREWQEREQDALQWCHRDAKLRPRGTGATVLLMLKERTTTGGRMAKMLYGAAEEFDALVKLAIEGDHAISEQRYRELAARCREAAS